MSSQKQAAQNAIVFALALLILVLPIMSVEASEPSDIELVYNFDSQSLTVNVSHYVPNTKTHYIESIEIKNNGLSVLNRTYVNQTYNWGIYDSFIVSADVGDNLTVIASCSKGYPITRYLVVTSDIATNSVTGTTSTTSTTNTTDVPELPGSTANLGLVTGVVICVILFFILFFAWLEPDRVPGGSRIRAGLYWFWEKLRGGISWLGTGISGFFKQIKDKIDTK